MRVYETDRAVVIIRKKQPYLDWIKRIPGFNLDVTLAEMNHEPTCYLIPASESDATLMNFMRKNCVFLFEQQLNESWTDQNDWEEDLNWKKFKQWFDIELISLPFDLGKYGISRNELE